MNEAIETYTEQRFSQKDSKSDIKENPEPDREAMAKYEAEYPGLVKDHVLARLIAVATNDFEVRIRVRLDQAIIQASNGNEADATRLITDAVKIGDVANERARLITDIYEKSKLILDGKTPTPIG